MSEVDTSRASIARVYDAVLGGKDNFEVDREVYESFMQVAPDMRNFARANRRWLIRVVAYLADRVGMDQFLDLGSGLPTTQNTHQVAQRYQPEATVVYVDNDPAVSAYGRALLVENTHTAFAAEDLTRPRDVFASDAVQQHLDLNRPLVLMHCATMPHVGDELDPWTIMRDYVDLLPSGSYVASTHAWNERDGSVTAEQATVLERAFQDSSMHSGYFRARADIEAFFAGLELLEPGVVAFDDWWPSGPAVTEPGIERIGLGGVGRKP